jgi:hypothetical protein
MQGCGDYQGESLPWNQACSDSMSINDRLSAFSEWRGKSASQDAGLWHLMTKCNTGPSVGVAWLDELCNKQATAQSKNERDQFITGAGVSSIVPTEYKVISHEIGHNFGAIHDCTSSDCSADKGPCSTEQVLRNPGGCSCCPCGNTKSSNCDCQGNFVMHPTDNSIRDSFSPCSSALMCQAIRAKGGCLRPLGSMKLIKAGVCGNGVKEEGEDCDCGAACADNRCCDDKCKFVGNARCDDRIESCCESCQIKKGGTVCRPSDDFCTQISRCSGSDGICPKPKLQADGTGCVLTQTKAAGTACASGTCTSRNMQCRSLINSGTFQTKDACPEYADSCRLRCTTPSGTCIENLNGDFIDGTPCIGGVCKDGSCSVSNPIALVSFYFTTQPQIAWPVTISILIIISGLLYCCLKCNPFSKIKERREAPAAFASRVNSVYKTISRGNTFKKYNESKRLPAVPVKDTSGLRRRSQDVSRSRNAVKTMDKPSPLSPQAPPQRPAITPQQPQQVMLSQQPQYIPIDPRTQQQQATAQMSSQDQAQYAYYLNEQQKASPNVDPRIQAEFAGYFHLFLRI